jgi:parvulin-like peptidyl-prolyl isomerase
MVTLSHLTIETEEIVNLLKREINLRDICHKVLHQQIISQAAQERGVVVTSEEVQAEADRQRHQKRLESASTTFAWLAEQLITPEDWENGIRDRLLAQKLAEFLFASEAEKYFIEHRLDFEKISLYQITVPYEQLAYELFYQIEESEISFYEAAHLYDLDERRRTQCGFEGQLYRWSLKPEISAMLLGEQLGKIVGPLKTDQGYDLLIAEEFLTAELTPEIRAEIVDRLFQGWLESELNYLLHQH